jgi:glycosyltransferase involved in cell wall biosynthesis
MNSRWLKPRTLWRARQICSRLLDENPGAVLHSFWLGWTSGIGEHFARKRGTHHITTLMGQDVLSSNRHRFRFLTPERQQRLVALSDFQNEVLAKNAGFRAGQVIPWGVSAGEIPSRLPEIRPVDVLGVGSLIPLKNWPLWLQTVAILVKNNPALQAELLGSGPERGRLQELADQLKLQKNVSFTEELPRPKALKKMLQAKLLLHTSMYESQGYVLSEAAMQGCRVLGTPVGIAPLMGPCAETAEALATLATAALAQPLLMAPATPFLLSDTAAAYRSLY